MFAVRRISCILKTTTRSVKSKCSSEKWSLVAWRDYNTYVNMRSSVQFENWSVPAYIGPKSIKYDEDNSYVLLCGRAHIEGIRLVVRRSTCPRVRLPRKKRKKYKQCKNSTLWGSVRVSWVRWGQEYGLLPVFIMNLRTSGPLDWTADYAY